MRRRTFIATLGGAAMWPVVVRGQQTSLPRIGWLGATEPNARLRSVFLKALAEADYIEGRNVAIEYRYAEGRYDRMPAMVTELVRQQVALIVASPTPAALAAKGGTATVPIVFGVTDDPVKLGLVSSLGRPGGNATGVYFFLSDLATKQLGLLRELAPVTNRFGLLVNPDNANVEAVTREMAAAASAIGVQIEVMRASDSPAINDAFAAFARNKIGALVVGADPMFFSRRVQLATLAARYAIPAVYTVREFPEAGGFLLPPRSSPPTARALRSAASPSPPHLALSMSHLATLRPRADVPLPARSSAPAQSLRRSPSPPARCGSALSPRSTSACRPPTCPPCAFTDPRSPEPSIRAPPAADVAHLAAQVRFIMSRPDKVRLAFARLQASILA